MRIGVDARPLGVGAGGIYRYTIALVESLAQLDGAREVVLFGRPFRMDLPEGVRWSPLWFPGKRWLDQLHLLRVGREIDIFHGTNYFVPLHASVPQVLTVHDLSVQLHPETHPRLRRLQHRLLPARLRAAKRIVVDSESVRSELLRLFPMDEARICVVPLAAHERFRPAAPDACARVRAELGLPDRFLLYVGALEPRKNLPALYRALASLRAAGSTPPLVVAGAGAPAYVAQLVRLAHELGLVAGHDLYLTGHVAEDLLPALYSACSVLVYPSLYEGFGLPPIEAMACGAPVITLRSSASVEMYRDAGLVVEAEGLPEAIRRVLEDDSLRADLIERGAHRARARRWSDVAREMLGVYEQALADA